MAPEAVLQREPLTGFDGTTDGRPQAPGRRQRPAEKWEGRRPPGSGPARPVTRLVRRINANGRRPCTDAPRSPTGAVFGGLATAQTDNVCASSRNGCFLDARSIFDGLDPAKLLRNSGQVEQAEGLPRSGDSKSGVAGSAGHTAFDDGATRSEAAPAGRLLA